MINTACKWIVLGFQVYFFQRQREVINENKVFVIWEAWLHELSYLRFFGDVTVFGSCVCKYEFCCRYVFCFLPFSYLEIQARCECTFLFIFPPCVSTFYKNKSALAFRRQSLEINTLLPSYSHGYC